MIKRRCQHEAEGLALIINSAAARFTAKSLNCEREMKSEFVSERKTEDKRFIPAPAALSKTCKQINV